MISLGSPKAALAVVLLFFYNGLVIGVYAASLTSIPTPVASSTHS